MTIGVLGRGGWRRVALGAAATLVAAAAQAKTDAEWIAEANAIYQGRDHAVVGDRRVESRLFPAMTGMEAPPAVVSTALRAAMAVPGRAEWEAAKAWAQGSSQRPALEALLEVGASGSGHRLTQGYGADAASDALVGAGLYTDLGEPPLLAGAWFAYLDKLDWLSSLVQVEATRLLEEGEAQSAGDLLLAWTRLARMVADREMAREMEWGMRAMVVGIERLLDIAHSWPEVMTSEAVASFATGLKKEDMTVSRLRPPRANVIAGRQLVERVYEDRGGPDPRTFGATMARLSAADRPLRMFGEAARWQTRAERQADVFDMSDAIQAAHGELEYRWTLDRFDAFQRVPTVLADSPADSYAALHVAMARLDELMALRDRLETQTAGARLALGVEAYSLRFDRFPPALAAIRPQFVPEIDRDPWSVYKGRFADFEYFVPIRDEPRSVREEPRPHQIVVTLPQLASVKPDPARALRALPSFEEVTADLPLPGELGERGRELAERAWGALREISVDLQTRVPQMLGSAAEGGDGSARGAGVSPESEAALNEAFAALEAVFAEQASLEGGASGALERWLDRALGRARRAGFIAAQGFGGGEVSTANMWGSAMAAMGGKEGGEDGGTGGGLSQFIVWVNDTDFVLASAGPDTRQERARVVGEGGTDFLIWPPLVSLLREKLGGVELTELPGSWIWHSPAAAPAELFDPPKAEDEQPRRRGGRRF